MVNALVFSCFLIGHQIPGTLHHHNSTVITLTAGTDRTDVLIRQGTALSAVVDIFLCIQDALRQMLHLVKRHIYNVESKPPGRLGADSGKLPQFFNQLRDLAAVIIHIRYPSLERKSASHASSETSGDFPHFAL